MGSRVHCGNLGRQHRDVRGRVLSRMRAPAAATVSLHGYERYYSEAAVLNATEAEAFAFADDFGKLSSHMFGSPMMMIGSSMRMVLDAGRGHTVGSHVTMAGRMLGVEISLEEVVRVREPPRRKEWETIGSPRLLVIGSYRLGFEIAPVNKKAELRVFIAYNLPSSIGKRLLGRFVGAAYARWCVRQMVNGARAEFS